MLIFLKRIKENPGPSCTILQNYGEGYFNFPKTRGTYGPRMQFQDYVMHPEVIEADAKAAADMECSIQWERAMSGETDQHFSWKRMADFVQKESAYLLNFGYQGMVSTIRCFGKMGKKMEAILDKKQWHAPKHWILPGIHFAENIFTGKILLLIIIKLQMLSIRLMLRKEVKGKTQENYNRLLNGFAPGAYSWFGQAAVRRRHIEIGVTQQKDQHYTPVSMNLIKIKNMRFG
ncbi:hypothetical protein FQA39_LY18731 [Lamprigera yunnana]|nr:hypothetical protein FQA39_LY18731 [Lamprigera yunnana]